MSTVKMSEMTVLEIREYLKSNKTIILPYGVVEQHGYHLPLDTDIRNAEVLSEKLAESLGCIVAPTLNYCFSGGMLEGTINIKPNTFSNIIIEIIESLLMQGFENILILPGHGGSESLLHLKESLRIAKWVNKTLQKALILCLPPWEFSPTWKEAFMAKDYHAGMIETSLIMYWTPELVKKDIVLDEAKIAEMQREDPDSFQVKTKLSNSKYEIPTTLQHPDIKVGVMGYPENANVELGKKVTDEIIKNISLELNKTLKEADKNRKAGKQIILNRSSEVKLKIF